MSRKKKHEHVNHERWLVSYADFITLLFAFFVVLFASSQADKKKQIKISAAMQSAFTPLAVFEAHSKNRLSPRTTTPRPTPLQPLSRFRFPPSKPTPPTRPSSISKSSSRLRKQQAEFLPAA